MRSVKNLIGGEILAEPIRTREENILIPKGTAIKIDYLPLIESLGIDSLMIEDPYEVYEEPHYIIDRTKKDSYVTKVRKILENHVHNHPDDFRQFKTIANDIVNDIDALSDDAAIDVSEHSADLYEHTVMVTLLSVLIAKKLKLKKVQRYAIALGGLLHDVGLRYITVNYENCDMNAADPLETFEYRKHTILGYCAMEKADWIPDISKKMILNHHERIDRSGFPMKQNNEEVECLIIQVCDAFESMISGIESKRTTVHDAIDYLKHQAGIQFDHQIIDELCKVVALYPVGTTIETSRRENTVVVSQTNDPERPIVMVLDIDEDTHELNDQAPCLNLAIEKDISILRVD